MSSLFFCLGILAIIASGASSYFAVVNAFNSDVLGAAVCAAGALISTGLMVFCLTIAIIGDDLDKVVAELKKEKKESGN